MAAFDPDKYLEQDKPSEEFNPDSYLADFNPDAYLEEAPEARTKTAVALGAVQGATMGWADEAAAAVKAGWDSAINQVVPKDKQDSKEFKQRYNEQLIKVRDYLNKLEQENPKAYTAGEIGGSIASLAVPGGAAAKGLGAVLKVNKLAKPVQTTLKAAMIGGVSGAGASEGENLTEVAKDTATGAAFGGALGAAAPAVGKLAGKAVGKMKDIAEFAQRKGIGLTNKTVSKMTPEELSEVTKFARDKNIITSSAEKTFENANKVRDEAGEALADITSQVQAVAKGPIIDKPALIERLGKMHEEQLANGQDKLAKTTKDLIRQVNKINPEDFAQIRKIRSNIGEEVSRFSGERQNIQKYRTASAVYGQLNDSITEGLTRLEQKIPDAALAKQFADANRNYKMAHTVASAAEKHAEQGSNILSSVIRRPAATIGPAAAGVATALTGAIGVPTAAAVTGMAYLIKKFGPTTAAKVQSMLEGPMAQKAQELLSNQKFAELAALAEKGAISTAVQDYVKPNEQERKARRDLFKQLPVPKP